MVNTTEIVEAFRNNLGRRKEIKKKHQEIIALYEKMINIDIPNINKIVNLVFKNINPNKKFVCDCDDFFGDYYSQSNDNKRKLFLNNYGFSMSYPFNPRIININKRDISRTKYIQTFNEREHIKIYKRLFKHKEEIINAINKNYKKTIAIRFFEGFEKSGCDKVLDYIEDFNYLKDELNNIPKKLIVQYYNNDEIQSLAIDFLQYNAKDFIVISKNENNRWSSRNSIELNDIEKISQIFDEVMAFLQKYYNHLDVQDKNLISFYNILKESFAKELILNSLKEQKQGKK